MAFLWCLVVNMRAHLVCYTHNVSTTLSYDLLQTFVIICLSILTSTIIFVVILTMFRALYLTAFFRRLVLALFDQPEHLGCYSPTIPSFHSTAFFRCLDIYMLYYSGQCNDLGCYTHNVSVTASYILLQTSVLYDLLL